MKRVDEAELCDNQLNGFAANNALKTIAKEKENQVKEKINSFIDLQVEQNIKVFKEERRDGVVLRCNLIFENGEALGIDKGNEIIDEILAILSTNEISLVVSKEILKEVEKEIYQRAKF